MQNTANSLRRTKNREDKKNHAENNLPENVKESGFYNVNDTRTDANRAHDVAPLAFWYPC
jgi:hypothetical protein